MDVRDNLAHLIRDHGIKQTFIAKKTGIADTKIAAILNKNRKLDANELILICDALNTTPTELCNYQSSA
jgi:DNA-binding Xre family transcriptional regulator